MEMQETHNIKKFVVMQDIGIPGQSNSGDGSDTETGSRMPDIKSPFFGKDNRQYGWYGYEGFEGGPGGFVGGFVGWTPLAAHGWSANGWTPIGDLATGFKQDFKGNKHIVSGLWIKKTANDFQGLFGHTDGADIYDLGVFLADKGIEGNEHCGSLSGHSNEGSIERCFSTGSKVKGAYLLGGLIGSIQNTTVKNCYATNAVDGNSSVGGLVGISLNGTVEYCYATGETNADNHIVGGCYGMNSTGTLSDCYYDSWSTSVSGSGGIEKTTAEMIDETHMNPLLTVLDDNMDTVWKMVNEVSYPYLAWQERSDNKFDFHLDTIKVNGEETMAVASPPMEAFTKYIFQKGNLISPSMFHAEPALLEPADRAYLANAGNVFLPASAPHEVYDSMHLVIQGASVDHIIKPNVVFIKSCDDLPEIVIEGDPAICIFNNTLLTATPPLGVWESLTRTVVSVPIETVGEIWGLAPGPAEVVYSINEDGCRDTKLINIMVKVPPTLTLNTNDEEDCVSLTVTINNNSFTNANSVLITKSENADGDLTYTSAFSSPFTIEYVPKLSDAGKTITITVITDPDTPCERAEETLTIFIHPKPVVHLKKKK
jgi:hypothetical protein